MVHQPASRPCRDSDWERRLLNPGARVELETSVVLRVVVVVVVELMSRYAPWKIAVEL